MKTLTSAIHGGVKLDEARLNGFNPSRRGIPYLVKLENKIRIRYIGVKFLRTRISLNVSRGARKSCVQFNWRKYAPRKNSAEQGLRGGFKKKKETASFPTYRPIKDVALSFLGQREESRLYFALCPGNSTWGCKKRRNVPSWQVILSKKSS